VLGVVHEHVGAGIAVESVRRTTARGITYDVSPPARSRRRTASGRRRSRRRRDRPVDGIGGGHRGLELSGACPGAA
jgi:hypothetical protein